VGDRPVRPDDAGHRTRADAQRQQPHRDAFPTEKFDYILANPPYGVDWKAYAAPIKAEHEKLGFHGRFGAGLPRVSDGSFLFLQHMLSHMKPTGSRVGIVLSGSPLFSGQAGSGESEIRRWILENDWLEGIVALPDQMFYNTGISTYVWILTNTKADEDRGTVKLIDARELGTKMRKSLGDKRKELTPGRDRRDRAPLRRSPRDEYAADPRVKVLTNETFGFQRITVERPMRRRWEVTPEAVADEPYAAYASLVGQRFETEKALLSEVAELTAAQKKIVRQGVRGGRPGGADHHRTRRQARAGPGSARPGERASAAGWLALGEQERDEGTRRDSRSALGERDSALRAGCVDRPHQDEGRFRDPVHPAVLRLHATSAGRRDRRRDQGTRSRRSSPG
jgi:type I restriction enzyme M protein